LEHLLLSCGGGGAGAGGREWLDQWIDSGTEGMVFVGMNPHNNNNNSKDGKDPKERDNSFISNSNSKVMTAAEFAALKRIHGSDPFPMSLSLGDEGEYWVPGEAARLGVDFMRAKAPHAPQTLIMDFLRDMNKVNYIVYLSFYLSH
jgi:hypothetical protein